MAAVTVSRQAIDTIRRGHPWIYRSNVVHISSLPNKTPGAIVRILDQEKRHVGVGVLDADSALAVRVWTSDPHEALDAKLFRSRLEAAIQIRMRLFADQDTTAYRILNGEGDRVPAFVVDRYADVAVLRMDGEAARTVSTELLQDIESPLRAIGITTLLSRGVPEKGKPPIVTSMFGPMREKVEVREHGVPFVVDLVRGQKTGAFLDQRENRRRIGELVKRRGRSSSGGNPTTRVLNLFSYTGGFSVRAALAGGIVTSVDVAAAAHASAQESFRLAGVDPKSHVFSTADAFQFLERAANEKKTWDVVISDPPSFAPNAQSKPKAISAYRALHRACVNVLAPGGTFVAASCSSHISAEDFMTTLDDAALGGQYALRVLELHGPPPDHPTLATFFEGRYLKLAILE